MHGLANSADGTCRSGLCEFNQMPDYLVNLRRMIPVL